MCWICDHPGATQQDYFEELRSRVQKHGWAVQYVEIDRAPYAYTVGLHDPLTFAVTRRLPRRPVRSRGIYGDRAELRQCP